jgi:hypothetical protein
MKVPSPTSIVNRELLFYSGFGGTTRLIPSVGPYFHGPKDQYEDIVGVDHTIPSPTPWEEISSNPNLGSLRIYYEEGNPRQRSAQIVPDEDNPDKKILRFQLAEPNVTINWPTGPEHKARVQAELYGNTDLREFYQTVRLRLGSDMQTLEQFPTPFHWLTIFEFWNQPFWIGDYPFRISIGIHKPTKETGQGLFFAVEAQKMIEMQKFEVLWNESQHGFRVPYNKWMTLELYYREGDSKSGRLYMAVTPDDGERQVIFDVHDCTYHPENPSPAGLTHYNPMKMYTSSQLVQFLRQRGQVMQLDWDEFSLWKGRTPPEHAAVAAAKPRPARMATPVIVPGGAI